MWRPLRRGELDHEALWLCVSLAALAGAWSWTRLGLVTPLCAFHELTGWPCPGCGATRCVQHLLRGEFHAAFLMNPLMLGTLCAVVFFDLYAVSTLALRLPRFRLAEVSARTARAVRAGCAALLVLNWAWLLYRRV